MCAPILSVLSRTSSIASRKALPPSASERLPPVPLLEYGELAVSPCSKVTSSMSISSASAAICANAVSWPWPCGRGAGVDGQLAARLDSRDGAFEAAGAHDLGWSEGADLDVAGEADAAQLALLAQLGGLRLELLVAGDLERLVERLRVVAAVVFQAERRLVRELVGPDEVALAHLGRVERKVVGDRVHHAFLEVGRFWAARAAVGIGGHLVGKHAVQVVLDVGEQVRAGTHQGGQRGDLGRAEVQVRAQVGQQPALEGEDRPIARARRADVVDLIAAVRHRGQVLAALLEPAHRAAEVHRQPGHEDLVGVDVGLGAEAATDLGRDHAHLVLAEPEELGDLRAHDMRELRP